MSTKIAICNSALITLGANTITSFTDGTTASTACSIKWDIVRRDLIALHPWNFAIKRASIAASVDVPVFRYNYQFNFPVDLLRLLKVYDVTDYKKEGLVLLTNQVMDPNSPEIEIKYLADIEDTSAWSGMFTDLMSARMAMELAYTLPRKSTMIDRMATVYQDKLTLARGVDAQEDVGDEIDQDMPETIKARLNGYNF